ncbi:TRAP transporter permease [Marinithermus hydrothermalis]|uniref:TRAP transporter, 4TM/12TM fusion protein n=1 Tax=Marinithermus hydrothermalis (strain DSM 14884 / JCM 11576 / T1) TaxID=869210 RepID=F2NQ47_MARHT|nr:TRAP transporter permease [Marinithermus hydrothermalis]AEB11358.1 TRAP transporter, 4TM/12TM fusion protein [Marinithermus hydrothermalis DSM 14884]
MSETHNQKAVELMQEVEYGARNPRAVWQRWLIFGIAVLWSLFQVWAIWLGSLEPERLGPMHLAFAFALAFLAYPSKRGPKDRIPWLDWVLAGLSVAGALYVVVNFYTIVVLQGGVPVPRDVVMGVLTLLTLFIAAVRVVGWALPIIASVLLLYAAMGPAGIIPITPPDVLYLHNGYGLRQIIGQLYLTSEGIWGTPIRVSATFVFLFVLFGALLDRAGAGKYFVDLAYSALGTFRGGPAKAAVVGSLLTGVISGSSIANVVTTGTFTIPLMRRVGYPPEKAGATEVGASTNGQLMPPIMGAAAFIMAEFLQIPYADLILYALIPALLSYIGLLYVVHLEALKLGLKGLPKEELPPFWPTFFSGLHYLIPVAWLMYELIGLRHTPERSALNAMFLLIGLILVQEVWRAWRSGRGPWQGLRTGLIEIINGFETGARNMTSIAIATAAAGIIVGVVTLTGLGFGLTDIVQALSGGNIVIVLILAAIASLILGLGLPTTANYIVMAALVVPVIRDLAQNAGVEIPLVAIHLFVFYFGILADDTPPVGLAAYAAAAIARSNPIKTGIQGFIYDMRTAILPFIFIFNPELLLLNIQSAWHAAGVVATALVGMLAFVAGTQGFLLTRMSWLERLPLIAAAFLLLRPGLTTDLVGFALIALVYLVQRYRLRQTPVQA